eukprot:CAMPEP_0119069536 /NCGR_PEP_ID=MMETSP1178-20130426/22389_1 /TAXON_ID=33656 /ORGANISM="unid sp, Strain CCMP2000" /LENGTH=86 /DNA_ID=CAMNT_0007051307 /DNA_START=63 /DNA_END=323 /DNA_ORIENTATION=+
MADEGATEHRRISLPWFLPFICFIPLLIAAPLWHRESAADAVSSNFVPDVKAVVQPQTSKPVVQQPAPRPVRTGTRKHNATRHAAG